MPGFFEGLSAIIAGTATVGQVFTVVSTAYAVGSSVSGYSSARKAKRAAADAATNARANQTIAIRSTTVPRRLAIGECMLAGPYAFAESTGTANNLLHLVFPLCEGPITAIDEIYINEEAVGTLNGSGFATDARWTKTTTPTAIQDATVDGSGNWTMTLSNTPSSVLSAIVLDLNTDNALPEVTKSVVGSVVSGTGQTPGATVRVNYTYTVTDASFVRVLKHLGSTTQAADSVLDAAFTEWTSAHQLKGVAYIVVILKRDDVILPQGVGNIKVKLRGSALYDPRSATSAYSTNHALAVRFYLTHAMGLGRSSSDMDDATFIAGANLCDEALSVVTNNPRITSPQPRFTCNGVIDLGLTPATILEDLCRGTGATPNESEGKWRYIGGSYTAPTITLDESDMAGYVEQQTRLPPDESFNGVRGLFTSKEKGFVWTSYPPFKSASYETDDGGAVWEDIPMPYVIDEIEANRNAKLMVELNRRELTVKMTCNLRKAFKLQPGDTVAVTLARFGWSSKVFRVVSWAFDFVGKINLELREIDASAYSWVAGDTGTIPPPAQSTLLSPFARPTKPNTVVVSSGVSLSEKRSDGSTQQMAKVQWAASTDAVVLNGGYVEVEHRRSNGSVWIAAAPVQGSNTDTKIGPVSVGDTIVVRVRFVSVNSVPSDWAHYSHQVSGTAVAYSVENLLANATFTDGQKWTVGNDGFSDPITFAKEVTYGPPGSPNTGRFRQTGTQSIGAEQILISDPMSVVAGQRYVAMSGLYANRCNGGYLNIRWYDATDTATGTDPTSAATADHGNDAPSTEAEFDIASCFATAPALAVSARLLIRKRATNLGSDSQLFLFKPLFGQVPTGITTLPQWTAGGQNVVDTGLIAENSATIVAHLSGSSMALTPMGPSPWSSADVLLTYSITPPVDCVLELSAATTLYGVYDSGPIMKPYIAVRLRVRQGATEIDGQSVTGIIGFGMTTGDEAEGNVSALVATPLDAGVTYICEFLASCALNFDPALATEYTMRVTLVNR